MPLFKLKLPTNSSNFQINIPSRAHLLLPDFKTIWAIGGGKGGIGKTLLTSNMAVFLSWLNKKVTVIDMDLGGANLHTSLGVDVPTRSLSDLILGRVEKMDELMQPTSFRNLFLISGAQDQIGIANLRHMQKARLLRKMKDLDSDFILIDLGAGTATNTLDFFLLADKKIILSTPEPTSIENAYRFIKSAFYRMLRSHTVSPEIRHLVEQAMDLKNMRGIRTPRDLILEVKRLSPKEGDLLESKLQDFRISLIINQVRVKAESDIGKSMQMVCEKYFGIPVDYLGYLPYDNSVWQAIRKRRPFLIDAPNSTAVTHLEEIVRNILKTLKKV